MSKDVLLLVSFWSLARGYENMNDHIQCLRKNQSNYVTWISYRLLLDLKEYGAAEEMSVIRDGLKHRCVASILSSQPHTPPPVLRRAPRSLGSALGKNNTFGTVKAIFIFVCTHNINKTLCFCKIKKTNRTRLPLTGALHKNKPKLFFLKDMMNISTESWFTTKLNN